ncbi:hypothetical protein LTR60_001521 [Cryomyces antarcticus]|nr:hypothetical protein LTR60_001521 [Cryomyces antarcticus]
MLLHAISERLQHRWEKSRDALREMVATEWYLGFTSFGGPAVHFQIFYKMFVQDLKWIEEQTVCIQAPQEGSTPKMKFLDIRAKKGYSIKKCSRYVKLSQDLEARK